MATISSTMALNDAMSPALQSIAASIQGVLTAFQQLQAAAGQAVNVQSIQAANDALEQTGDAAEEVAQNMDDATDAIEQSEQAQNNLNASMSQGSSAASDLWSKIKGFIAAYAGWEMVKRTVQWSDEMTNLQARLAAVNDGTRTADGLMTAVYEAAQRSHASLQGMADIVGRFGNNAREAFSSNDELIAFSEQLNKMFSIAGTDANGAAAAMLQLSQGLGAGALRGEELNSVFEQAPNIIRTIADHMGVPIGQIRELASQGKLTADIVKGAILGAAQKNNEEFAKMPLTFGAAWTMAKNTFQMNMMGLQRTISGLFNTGEFQAMMDGLTKAVSALASFAIPVVKGLAAGVKFLYNNWSLIAPVIFTVIGALTAYRAAVLWTAAAEAIQKGIKIVGIVASYAKAAATGTEVAATTAATAAQWGLNAAMLASPTTWIIAAIIAIVGVLYLTVAAINKVTGSTYSATGIIAGLVWGLWAYIRNIIATVWNTLVSLAEFFYNVWTNPVYSLKQLLYSLLETFANLFGGILKGLDPVVTSIAKGIMWAVNKGIQALNWLSSALDTIGLGWGKMAEVTMEGTVASNFEGVKSSMLSAVNPGEAPEGYKSFGGAKMDFVDPTEYAVAGYEAGANFADDPAKAIQDALSLGEDPAIQQMLDNQQKQLGATKQVAENTEAKPEEDYKYLKDIMAGRAVDRLAGTDIRIQMNNNNNVNSKLDLDGIVGALASRLTQAMDSAAEGVHY